jgi:hypothetical protein
MPEAAEDLRGARHRLLGVHASGGEGLRRGRDAGEVCRGALARRRLRERWLDISFEPGRRSTRPRLSSSRSASRTVERCTPNWRASSISDGSRSPSRSARDSTRAPIAAATLR